MNNRIVTEGISGMWHYHLSDPKTFTRGLCGAKTMKTAIEAVDFGKSFGDHFPKRPTWCATCHELATQQQPVASAVRPSPHEISTGGNERSPHLGRIIWRDLRQMFHIAAHEAHKADQKPDASV